MTTDRPGSDQNRLRTRSPYLDIPLQPYYVELPLEMLDDQGSMLDSVIRFTFDTLHVQHLDLRIVAEAAPVVSSQNNEVIVPYAASGSEITLSRYE